MGRFWEGFGRQNRSKIDQKPTQKGCSLPRCLQNTSEKLPRDAPKMPQEDPKMPQDAPKLLQDAPKIPQDHPRWFQDGTNLDQKSIQKKMIDFLIPKSATCKQIKTVLATSLLHVLDPNTGTIKASTLTPNTTFTLHTSTSTQEKPSMQPQPQQPPTRLARRNARSV